MRLAGRKVLLGISGSIAAYKTAFLVRHLVRLGAEVRIVMTPSARQFITPVTLATLAKNPVYIDLADADSGIWANHVDLARWAELMVVAPASANTLAKMATGQCDNVLLVSYLSASCPVVVAPAMDVDMWSHPATQQSIRILKERGVRIIGPTAGELASGLVGLGRMVEPEVIGDYLESFFNPKLVNLRFAGKRVLVTAGPTYEAIDPVRFIGNYSSGKMGFALAESLAAEGASVTLVSGPSACQVEHEGITLCRVVSAQEMFEACSTVFPLCGIAIFSAAVADYRPTERSDQKMKKSGVRYTLSLTATPDIAAELGKQKQPGQFTVGFALETDSGEESARKKLVDKNLDMIVLNSLSDPGAGFGGDFNKVSLLSKDGEMIGFDLKEKRAVAQDIVNMIAKKYA